MARRFLLQMHGEPGAGKSTLALAIGRETGAVVLDEDIIKARMLDGEPERGLDGLPEAVAAPLHWAVMFDLARSLLDQGFSVVLDGVASFTLVRERGRGLAEAAGVSYFIIDCHCPDLAVLQARIDSKTLLSSQWQVAGLGSYSRPGTAPLTEPHLLLDTRRPFEDYLAEALEYLGYTPGKGDEG